MWADPEAVPRQSCPFKPFTLLITCSPQAFLQFHSVPLSKTIFLKWGKAIAEEVAVMGGRMHSAPPPAQHSELSFKSERYQICWAGCFANRKLEESESSTHSTGTGRLLTGETVTRKAIRQLARLFVCFFTPYQPVDPDIFNYIIKHLASEGIRVHTSLSDVHVIYNVHCTNDETRCTDITG